MLSWQPKTYKPSKLGQTDLVFSTRSEFISRSVHARLQVSMYSIAVMICATLVNTHTDRHAFDCLYSELMKLQSTQGV